MSPRGRQDGQALGLVLGFGFLLLAAGAMVFTLGRAHAAKGLAQTGADLTAVGMARDMAGELADAAALTGSSRDAWRDRVRHRAARLARAQGVRVVRLTWPEAAGWPPTQVQVTVATAGPAGTTLRASARARIRPGFGALPESDGGVGPEYRGPLLYRDGKPTCPAVAHAFDRMDAAAHRSGVDLVVNSGFRSDAEQAVLFARHPDPKWVAPPGHSRHRNATELDIAGDGGAWDWLARNAGAFGFVQRYSWEPWHYGFMPGCAAADAGVGAGVGSSDDEPGGSFIPAGAVDPAPGRRPVAPRPAEATLPVWVPAEYRADVLDAAASGGVPPIVLAALLQQESEYNPRAVSPVGAQGIAQFMPDTARGIGLANPFEPHSAIRAAGRLLGSHLRRFGSIPLALAAYNAGEGAVTKYGGIPPYRETQAYVARIMALAGDPTLADPAWGGGVELIRIDEKLV